MGLAAAILVGGLGTRLRSVINNLPKPLAPINGEPFLYLLLRALKKNKITEVVLLTGYLHEKIEQACGTGDQFGLKIHYAHEKELLGTAGALKNAESYLKKFPEFLVLNGDSFCLEAIEKLANKPLEKNQLGSLAVSFVDNACRFGTVVFDEFDHIISFQEKALEDSGYVNAGVYRLSSDVFTKIASNTVCSLEKEVFPTCIRQCPPYLCVVVVNGSFDDIGLPESYQNFSYHYDGH